MGVGAPVAVMTVLLVVLLLVLLVVVVDIVAMAILVGVPRPVADDAEDKKVGGHHPVTWAVVQPY